MAQKSNKDNKKEQKNEMLIVTASVIRAFRGTTEFDDKEKNRVTIKAEGFDYSQIWAYDDCGPKYTPAWLKDAEGFINLSSQYDIPVKNGDGEKVSFADWIKEGLFRGALVKAKIRQTEGAIYPVCFVVLENGEPYDPFEDME